MESQVLHHGIFLFTLCGVIAGSSMSTVECTVSFISLLALYNSDEVIVLSMTEYVTNNHGKSSQVNFLSEK